MKRLLPYIVIVACIFGLVLSCDEGLQPSSKNDLTDILHPESGKEPLEDAKLGFFYENDYIAPMFNPFKTKEEYDAIAANEHSKFLHVAADSCNTVDIVTALAEYEDMSFRERIKAKSDLRYQMMYVNTYPSDAKYEVISLESSDENVLNPVQLDGKSFFMELVGKGNANLTLTVSDGKKVIKKVYPMAVIAEVPIFFNCDNVWFYGGESVPIQKITIKYAFPKLPKNMNKLDFLAKAHAKCYRKCSFRDEPNFGNRWFHVVDTVYFKEVKFVESLESEKEKSFLVIRGDHFNPYWEWDRFYTEYMDTVKNEKVRVLHEVKTPYEIYMVMLYFDGTPFDRHFDMDGSVGETTFAAINTDWRMDQSLNAFFNLDYAYVDAYYREMGYLWNPEKAEHSILDLYFNEFLTDAQIDSLVNSMTSEYYSHGWSDYQVDSIFNANYEYIQGYKRDK